MMPQADLSAIDFCDGADIWEVIGYDLDDPAHIARIHILKERDLFAVAREIETLGFHGAAIPNTLRKGGPPEIVIFRPETVAMRGQHRKFPAGNRNGLTPDT